ncbi:MAG: hypothetical protein KAR06_02420 [Deltaproteobacteria bacterium]|nr:hypothetical protein [Deltaproteobacteria bacterium]
MKNLIIISLLTIFVTSAYAGSIKSIGTTTVTDTPNRTISIMAAKTSTGDGEIYAVHPLARTVDVKVVGTGAVTATVIIYVSNTGGSDDWIEAGTITLSGTTSDADGFAMNAKWAYLKANVSAISGTGAAVTGTLGV